MKNFNIKHAKKHLCNLIHKSNIHKDFEVDDDGRIVIFTNLFIWNDHSIHDTPEAEDNLPELSQEIFFKEDGSISSVVTN